MRSTRSFGKRLLLIGDQLGGTLAPGRSRASSYDLLIIIRRIATHLLATGSSLAPRWVSSELNDTADKSSRRWAAD
eukprot:8431531-Pyramimonas_sp.AAC.1